LLAAVQTPLMYAAAGGNEEVLLQLLSAGAARTLVDAAVRLKGPHSAD
jgi:ankyrin repeat protein